LRCDVWVGSEECHERFDACRNAMCGRASMGWGKREARRVALAEKQGLAVEHNLAGAQIPHVAAQQRRRKGLGVEP